MTAPVTPQRNDTTDPEWTGIRTLGHANRFSTWDSEFRYDGRIRVPVGVKIKEIKYSYTGNDRAETGATYNKRGSGGTGEQYEIIDLTFLADSDVITFTLRGDLNVDTDPRPAYSTKYQVRVDVTLDNGEVRTAKPEIEVLAGAWSKSDPELVGRPFVRLPYDSNWGGSPNGYSQAGFGYVSDNGRIPGDKFIVDLVNLRQSEPDVPGNNSDHVYYQLIHEDGTPSHDTLTPQLLKAEGHRDSGTGRKVTLPALDLRQLGDKPGYYRFLVWPQATNPDGSPSSLSWDQAKPEDAFQLGSVYYRYTAPLAPGRLSVSPGGPVTLVRGGEAKYAGVELQNVGGGTVPVQRVSVSLPPGKGLQFTSAQLIVGAVRDGQWQQVGSYEGTLSEHGHTLTFERVDLALLGPGSKSGALVQVAASASTPLEDTSLSFQVGDQTSASSLIRITAQ
ncbi:hypothetical protein [Streptomyces sp. NPDC021622]|uniref:hypothetical protein n=1 Tax=Streptomyces sp. NPDC021622 TaxID=3155013 RepID=UPI003403DA8E